jgi:hypothetical protein
MGYSQKPGRSPMLKTGRGLSPTLMSCSPMKQGDFELTENFSRGVKKKAIARGKSSAEALKNNSQGIVIDPASGKATAKGYEKKFVPADNKGKNTASIVSGEGKTVKQASGYAGKSKENSEKLYKEYKSDSTSTMNTRNRNAEQYNITSGSKSPDKANARERRLLVKLGQASNN